MLGIQREYSFPFNELHIDNPKPGDVGEITIKVEVMSVDKEGVRLMQHGEAKVTQPFKDMDLEELRNRIGTVDDEEMPMKKEHK